MGIYWDIIILAAIAGFFLFRLRNVLGRRTGHEDPGSDWLKPDEQNPENRGRQLEQSGDNVVRLAEPDAAEQRAQNDGNIGRVAEEGSDLYAALQSILAAEHSFDAEQFLDGSRSAYKMIIEAFGAGDLKKLRGLLGEDVQTSFEASIENHKRDGVSDRKEVVGIISADLVAASLEANAAELSVKFQAPDCSHRPGSGIRATPAVERTSYRQFVLPDRLDRGLRNACRYSVREHLRRFLPRRRLVL